MERDLALSDCQCANGIYWRVLETAGFCILHFTWNYIIGCFCFSLDATGHKACFLIKH